MFCLLKYFNLFFKHCCRFWYTFYICVCYGLFLLLYPIKTECTCTVKPIHYRYVSGLAPYYVEFSWTCMRNFKRYGWCNYTFQVGPGCNHKGMFLLLKSWYSFSIKWRWDVRKCVHIYANVLRNGKLLFLSDFIHCVWRVMLSLLAKSAWWIFIRFATQLDLAVQYSIMLTGLVCTLTGRSMCIIAWKRRTSLMSSFRIC